MEETALLGKIYQLEKKNDFYSTTLLGVPLYRLFRYRTRLAYINTQVDFKTRTASVKAVGKRKIKLLSDFRHYKKKEDLTVIVPFNRLSLEGVTFLDKFTDPVLEYSGLKDSNYVIVDPASYISGYGRIHKDNVLSNETRAIPFMFLKWFAKVYVPIRYGKTIKQFSKKVQETLRLPDHYLSDFRDGVASFYASYRHYLYWFKRIKPRRVLFVFREGCLPILVACKKLSIPIAEFQHGITLDKTMAYTGEYDSRIDPDYFLSFGSYWKPESFGMLSSNFFNIGWAYKRHIERNDSQVKKDSVLVISSTAISTEILKALELLSNAYPQVSFHIRLHPAECYNKEQKELLSRIPNASIVDNKQESFSILSSYEYVIGEASSVLFEALSVGCSVGMLNLCGLRPPVHTPGIKENFYIISEVSDFEGFLHSNHDSTSAKEEFYSDFNEELFNSVMNEKM